MGKLRDYSFIVNLRPNVLFFAEAGERKQMESLSRSSKKKKEGQIAVFLPILHSALFTRNLGVGNGELVQRLPQLEAGTRKEKAQENQTFITITV